MDIRITLSKIVTLIYRTRIVDNLENDDLVRTILNTIKTDSPEFSFGNTNIPKALKALCVELLEDKEAIPKETLLPRLTLLLEHDQKLLASIRESIDTDYDDSSNKRIIASLIKHLYNYHKEHQATEIISKIAYDLKFNRSKIPNFAAYLQTTIAQLEPFTIAHTSIKDPALVNEMDFESEESVNTVFDEVKKLNNNQSVYRTGWQAFNRMTNGGIRRGEFVTFSALPHRYKTGTTLSLFTQIPTLNSPIVTKEETEAGKKPLLLRISYEDSLVNNLAFMFSYLKATEGVFYKPSDFDTLDTKEMSAYVIKKMTATGFTIKMLRMDPNQCSYSTVMNKVLELEAQGYAIHILMLDYVTLLPTTGCTQGAIGSDKKDLVLRIRNFCSARNIAFMTPLQLSSEAKQQLRNGIPEHDLVNQIAEKGFYDGCKGLDQHIDLDIYVHLFTHKRKKYLAFRRGKHRGHVVDDSHKYFMLRFPGLHTPILEDINGEDTSFSKLPRDFEGTEGGSLLDEVLG